MVRVASGLNWARVAAGFSRLASTARAASVIGGLALLTVTGVVSPAVAADNIMVIIADDVGVDMLGIYDEGGACDGSLAACQIDTDCPAGEVCQTDYPLTPNIAALSASGLLFRNAWANPTCSPTRASILTGRYGFRNTVIRAGLTLPAAEVTLAELLALSGYATAAIGKWHLGGGITGPNDQGFAHYAGALTNLNGTLGSCSSSGATCFVDSDCPLGGENCGAGGPGEDYFHWVQTEDGLQALVQPDPPTIPDEEAYATTINVDQMLSWLSDPLTTEPWFLWLAFNAPHGPFSVPPHDLISLATLATLPMVGGSPAPAGTACLGQQRRPCYLAMIEAMDSEIGRVLAQVPAGTTVIFLGDNGSPRGVTDPPFDSLKAKNTVYEGGLNVPLIVAGPLVQNPGAEVVALVNSADLFATVLDLAGAPGPLDRTLDAVSLVPYLANPTLQLRTEVYGEVQTRRAMRGTRFKLIRQDGADEFYDLEGHPPAVPADPFETNDLLAGNCSGGGAAVCHSDGDCAGSQTCDVVALTALQQMHRDSLALNMDLLLASCDPWTCAGPISCATTVGNLTASLSAPDVVALDWADASGATLYDVLRGDVETLQATQGAYAAAIGVCLANDLPGTLVTDGALPASGQTYWYLARAAGSPCNGTYGDGSESPGLRDFLISAAVSGCD